MTLTKEEKEVLERAREIEIRRWEEQRAREDGRRRRPEFELIHEEEGYRIYRRNTQIVQWRLYYGEELITTSQYRKGVFGVLNHVLKLKNFAEAFASA